MYSLIAILFVCWSYVGGMNNITSKVFGTDTSGLLAAFGDFNSDKLTDIFRISNDRRTVDILFGRDVEPILQKSSVKCRFDAKTIITSVMPSDFDGDSKMDVLVTTIASDSENETNEVRILWGNKSNLDCDEDTHFAAIGQPLVFDYDGDMIADLFGMNERGIKTVWTFGAGRNFTEIRLGHDGSKLAVPHSCAFVDLNGDMVADLFVTCEESIQYWINDGGKFELNVSLPYPKDAVLHGQVTFGDINSDGVLEKILPVCKDPLCFSSSITVWDEMKEDWETLFSDFQRDNVTWGFRPLGKTVLEKSTYPIVLRMADFNMDGYPDFLGIVQSKVTNISKAVLLINKECSTCPFGRTLHADWTLADLDRSNNNVQIATFYDIFQNGKMDILLVSQNNNKWQISAVENIVSYDAYFIKVLVLNGLCNVDCVDGNVPYGTNYPGAFIKYYTTDSDSSKRRSSAVQLHQSAYFSLQLPYSVFGLGETPNFVDKLYVTIPGFSNDNVRKHEWNQIIPNSQMVVIPHPPDNPKKWVNKLFVTPSRLVILTLLALVGTCIVICTIIGLLHWKEKREDRREKLQEAHRFHFDAM
ncbi:T-cell immunomodulatory protein [Centruroides vittatus]|uniref:T-cell immunomodulatory protein n=1 Tax=Centruroides vittatus TaxID=120091 RepID=UPI00350EB56D